MCGIAGIISENKREAIQRMNNVLSHRGPDEEGYYHDDICAFLGGLVFLAGALVMAYNLWKTVAGARIADAAIPAPAH